MRVCRLRAHLQASLHPRCAKKILLVCSKQLPFGHIICSYLFSFLLAFSTRAKLLSFLSRLIRPFALVSATRNSYPRGMLALKDNLPSTLPFRRFIRAFGLSTARQFLFASKCGDDGRCSLKNVRNSNSPDARLFNSKRRSLLSLSECCVRRGSLPLPRWFFLFFSLISSFLDRPEEPLLFVARRFLRYSRLRRADSSRTRVHLGALIDRCSVAQRAAG